MEAEVRELNGLLDAKDERLEMLSNLRMHNNRSTAHSSMGGSPIIVSSPEGSPSPKEDTFKPLNRQDFFHEFKRKLSGRSNSSFDPENFLPSYKDAPSAAQINAHTLSTPPRLFSDRCINIFWQEHAPLFPVLHKPTFLRLYEDYVASPEEMTDDHKLAKLFLVFSIGGLGEDPEIATMCEMQWRKSLNAILLDGSLATLQCLVLASLYCMQTGAAGLSEFKGLAVGIAYKLGLHQCQKRFNNGPLAAETRKKAFWTLYVVDCFSAASMGSPQLLQDADIETEYPIAIDDEYVEESRFLPTLPGEKSKLSPALALFDVTRVLSKVLRKLYPANGAGVSVSTVEALEIELDDWNRNLDQHLKLTFIADKPSTLVTGDRSSLLSLAYYHIRSLLHIPRLAFAPSSVMALGDSSKHIVQLVELLEERSMSWAMCCNRNSTLVLAGLALIYQSIDLRENGSLMRDNQRLICTISSYLEKYKAKEAGEFKRLIASLASSTFNNTLSNAKSTIKTANTTGRTKSASPTQPHARHIVIPSGGSGASRHNSFHGTDSAPLSGLSSSSLDSAILESELTLQQERMRRATIHRSTFPPQNSLTTQQNNGVSPALNFNGVPRKMAAMRHGSNGSLVSDYRRGAAAQQSGVAPQSGESAAVRSSPSVVGSSDRSDSGSPLDYMSMATPSPPTMVEQKHQQLGDGKKVQQRRSESDFLSVQQQQQQQQYKQEYKQQNLGSAEWEALLSGLDSGSTNIFDAVYGGTTPSTIAIPIHPLPQQGYVNQQAPSIGDSSLGGYEDWETVGNQGWVNLDFQGEVATDSGLAQSVFSFSDETLSSDGEGGQKNGLEYPGLAEYRQMFELY